MIDSGGNMCLTVDYLIKINNIVTGSNNITYRKVNVKPSGFDKMYMKKDLIEEKFYQIIDQFNERKITPTTLKCTPKIHSFYNGNDKMYEVLFANDDKINLSMRQ